ncbi:hypothetical protein I5M32_16390 [Pedobacter sp. SD-b]|uniref:Lipoprotein n=1 Tax=Pedobacter segetis TaxID=2793069 RepID=A0ABS1BNU6_9SPHI|nr:hypothetical protein [Pedobacter segetis]MBK0384541.1 hypothetical protein [Pedobacter segetis]
MKQRLFITLTFTSLVLLGCSTPKEFMMPFRNFEYTSDRGFPVKSSNSDFTFKASVNISTNVDRIVTVSMDSTFGNEATLLEVFSYKKGKSKLSQTKLFPKSGFDNFKIKIDSLNLMNQKDQETFESALHRPVTLFVVEIKENGKYNQFRFNTFFPDTAKTSEQYEKLQKLIFKEFHFPLYIK